MYLHFDVNLNSHNHKTPVLEKDTNLKFCFNSKLSQSDSVSELNLFLIFFFNNKKITID